MNTKTENKKRYDSLSPAVEQAAEILKYLASKPRIKAGLSEICRAVEINKSKTYAILAALQNAGFVLKNEENKLYSLGPHLIPIGQTALRNLDFESVAKQYIKELSEETMSTVLFGIINSDKLIIISKHASGQEFDSHLKVGSSRELFYKSHGKVILAALPANEQNRLLSVDNFFKDPDLGAIKNSTLKKEIKEINKKGYAWNSGRLNSLIKALSAVVVGHDDHPVGAVIIHGLIDESDIPDYGKKIVKTTKKIANALGLKK